MGGLWEAKVKREEGVAATEAGGRRWTVVWEGQRKRSVWYAGREVLCIWGLAVKGFRATLRLLRVLLGVSLVLSC